MKEFFSFDSKELFIPFGAEHLITLAVIVLFWIGILLMLKFSKGNNHKAFRISLALILVSLELSNTLWRIVTGHFHVGDSLPLQLCGISSFIAAGMLCSRNVYLFEFIYFAGMGGALQAILTPDDIHSFPHFDFFQHFITHSGLILSALYMVFIEKYYPKWISIVRVLVVLNVYLIMMYVFNYYTGGNYLFINYPPPNPSIIDLFVKIFGPHPWYIIGLELTAVVTFILFKIPFAMHRTAGK
jgi:hypothetical integral membrane protein (TIGR02206 family)